MRGLSGVVGAVLFLSAGAAPLAAQAEAWQKKWWWGAQASGFLYKTPAQTGNKIAVDVGGHWLITGKRSALYISFNQIIFESGTQSAIFDGASTRLVDFGNGRRIQAMLYAIPSDTKLQVLAGGGFAIHQITDAVAQGPFASPQEQLSVENALSNFDTKAFAVLSAGVQYRFRDRWAVFGQYQFMPSSGDFLINSETHALTGGVRFSLTDSHEEVSTER